MTSHAQSALSSQAFQMEVILPFIELVGESPILFGPLLFSPASLPCLEKEEDRMGLHAYLHAIGLMNNNNLSNNLSSEASPQQGLSSSLMLSQMTCLSIHPEFSHLSEKKKKSLLVDALYLLYFASYFRNLYAGEEVPSFNSFRKMIPASLEFIREKRNWEYLSIQAIDQEKTIRLHCVDLEICQRLGSLLDGIYRTPSTDSSPLPPSRAVFTSSVTDSVGCDWPSAAPRSSEIAKAIPSSRVAPSGPSRLTESVTEEVNTAPSRIQMYKRFVRAIRYFVDRLFHRFVNLFDKKSLFAGDAFGAFEAEEIIFLASSFEVLFEMSDRQTVADFKHKLRSLLHLKYGRPIEMFWKWVDDFYALKQAVIRGDVLSDSDSLFRLNPNFEISHLFLGTKLFIYSVYHLLFHSPPLPPYPPPILAEDLLLFFWTEESLLHQLNFSIKQIRRAPQEDLYADIRLLSHTYVYLSERYRFGKQEISGVRVRFIPSPSHQLKREGEAILEQLAQDRAESSIEIPKGKLEQALDPHFLDALAILWDGDFFRF